MYDRIYWREDSFGADLPENWQEIAAQANALIEDYAYSLDHDDPETVEEACRDYSASLWERYSETGSLA